MPTTVAPVCVCGQERERHCHGAPEPTEAPPTFVCVLACPCVLYVPGCAWCGDPLSEDAVEEGRRFCGESCSLSDQGRL